MSSDKPPHEVTNFPTIGGNPRNIVATLTKMVEDGEVEVICAQVITKTDGLHCLVAAPFTRDVALCQAMIAADLADHLKPFPID